MDHGRKDQGDGFGGRRPDAQHDLALDQPYGVRSLGATTDLAVQLDRGDVRIGPADDERAVQAAAEHGTSGVATGLPHQEAIQRSFGRHDVSGVAAHVGGAAREGAEAMGASAFATGNQVAFAGAPSLHTAAHEAAHVVQQRAGVHLKGGVGAAGDAYEHHADQVADRVVAGQSAEALLDEVKPSSGGGAIQRVVQMERFIGKEAKHHLHVEINQDHYKFGNDKGSRIEIGKNGVYKLDQLIVARNYLVNGDGAEGAAACITWLEAECEGHKDWNEDVGYKPSWEVTEIEANPHADGILEQGAETGLGRDGFENALIQAKAEVLEAQAGKLEGGNHYTAGTTAGDLEETLEAVTLDQVLAGWSGFGDGGHDPRALAEEFKRAAKEYLRIQLMDEYPLPTGKYDDM